MNNSPQMTALENKMISNLIRPKLPYLFVYRIHGRHAQKNFDLKVFRLKKTRIVLENILRWEDDGGQINDELVDRVNPSGHPVATRVNRVTQSTTAHPDPFNSKISAEQAYKDEYLVNDSPGG